MKRKPKLRWQKAPHYRGIEAEAGNTRLATIWKGDGPRPWHLEIQGPDACTPMFFSARFHSLADAKLVADLMIDVKLLTAIAYDGVCRGFN